MLQQIKDEKIIRYLENSKNVKEKLFCEQVSFDKVYQSITKTVIGQNVPISKLLFTIFTNQSYIDSKMNKNRIHELKENILLVGPTGVGKAGRSKKPKIISN